MVLLPRKGDKGKVELIMDQTHTWAAVWSGGKQNHPHHHPPPPFPHHHHHHPHPHPHPHHHHHHHMHVGVVAMIVSCPTRLSSSWRWQPQIALIENNTN